MHVIMFQSIRYLRGIGNRVFLFIFSFFSFLNFSFQNHNLKKMTDQQQQQQPDSVMQVDPPPEMPSAGGAPGETADPPQLKDALLMPVEQGVWSPAAAGRARRWYTEVGKITRLMGGGLVSGWKSLHASQVEEQTTLTLDDWKDLQQRAPKKDVSTTDIDEYIKLRGWEENDLAQEHSKFILAKERRLAVNPEDAP